MKCPQCQRATQQPEPNYDFNRLCCRVRFLHILPDDDIRADWLRRWRTQGLNAQQTHDTYQTQRKQTIDKH